MNVLDECLAVTERLIELTQTIDQQQRDEVIVEIEELLSRREELIPLIKGPFSPNEKELVKQLLGYSNQLPIQLGKIRRQIQLDINQLDQKKISAARYTNPYATMQQLDGAFYDKRK